jgi:hypothetical protein
VQFGSLARQIVFRAVAAPQIGAPTNATEDVLPRSTSSFSRNADPIVFAVLAFAAISPVPFLEQPNYAAVELGFDKGKVGSVPVEMQHFRSLLTAVPARFGDPAGSHFGFAADSL